MCSMTRRRKILQFFFFFSIVDLALKLCGIFIVAYKDVSECWNCTAGFYCSEPGRDSPVGKCDPGHYCPIGSSSSMEVRCEPGTYCIGQNEEAELCPIGTFQPSYTRTSITDCINCTAGVYTCGIFED